jgi:alkylation response protein AidB-like acyl-CoA dehydrogenase
MDFELDDQQQEFVVAVRSFAINKLAAGARSRARSIEFPWDAARALGAQGLLGITAPVEDGGQGGTLLDAVLAVETVASVCPRSADVVQAGNFGAIRTLIEYGSNELKAKYLPNLLSGENVLALGMSEPDAGSAVTDLRTKAEFNGETIVINGSKVFSSHSADAETFLIYARFGPGVRGIGSVIVDRDTPGFTIGSPNTYMSGEVWCPLYFEDCAIPKSNLLLGEGGFKKQIMGFNVERLGNSARAIALGRYAFNEARDYALDRYQFGRPLAEFQGIQWKFADMAVKLESAELLVRRAAVHASTGLPDGFETSIAKLAANAAGFEVANEALQVMGGAGYTQDSLVEYCFRRTRGWMIAGGSMEMMRNRVAESVFGRHFSQRPPEV